jgi:hypothetical protein
MLWVYCEVWSEYLNKIQIKFNLQNIKEVAGNAFFQLAGMYST